MKLIGKLPDRPSPLWRGAQFLAITTIGEYNRIFALGGPAQERYQRVVSSVTGNRLFLEGFNDYGSDYWNGANLRVFRVENGKFRLLRTSTVAASKSDVSTIGPSATSVVTQTASPAFKFKIENFYRLNVGYPVRVRTIDTNDQFSAWTAFDNSATPTVRSDNGADLSNTTTDLGAEPTSGGSLSTPSGLSVSINAENVLEATWTAVADAKGYQVQVLYQDEADHSDENYIDISDDGGEQVRAGDILLMDQTAPKQNANVSWRIWNAATEETYDFPSFDRDVELAGYGSEWVAYSGSPPSGVDATHYLKVVPQASTSDFIINTAIADDVYKAFYRTLLPSRTYRVEIHATGQSGDGTDVTVDWSVHNTTDNSGTFSFPDGVPTVRTSDVTVSSLNTTNGEVQFLRLQNLSHELHIHQMTFYEAGYGSDAVQQDIAAVFPTHPTFMRDHTLIKPGRYRTTPDASMFRDGENAVRKSSVKQHLEVCKASNDLPWLQIEWHHDSQFWQDFVAYMAAPSDSGHPMADLRVAQGQPATWLSEFGRCILEISNETWNTLPEFWNPDTTTDLRDGTEYSRANMTGFWTNWCIEQMRKSPYWPAFRRKVEFYIGAFANSSLEEGILSRCDIKPGTGITSYIGAWEAGTEALDENAAGGTYLSALSVAERDGDTFSYSARYSASIAAGARFVFGYEGGPSYSFPNSITPSTEIVEERIRKSVGMATAHMDAVAYRAVLGWNGENYFNTKFGDRWALISHSHEQAAEYPAFALQRLVWDHTGPATVTELATTQSETFSYDGASYPASAAYMFTSVADPTNRVVMVINRNIEESALETADADYSSDVRGPHEVSVNTGLSNVSGMEYFILKNSADGTFNMRYHNRYPVGQKVNIVTDEGGNETKDGYTADSLCVAFDYSWVSGTAPGNPGTIPIDDSVGALPGGLPPAHCVLLKLTGAV